jgi:hypothetical protein
MSTDYTVLSFPEYRSHVQPGGVMVHQRRSNLVEDRVSQCHKPGVLGEEVGPGGFLHHAGLQRITQRLNCTRRWVGRHDDVQ